MHDYDRLRRLTIDVEEADIKLDELRTIIWKAAAQITAMTEAYCGHAPVTDCGDYALRVVTGV